MSRRRAETYLISLYVDDILIAGSDPSKIAEIKFEFTARYAMNDLGELNQKVDVKLSDHDKILADHNERLVALEPPQRL